MGVWEGKVAMPSGTDRRVRRTRKLLQDGLLSLLQVKPLADITVKELAEHADVARATVYVHFKDPADVLLQLEETIYSEMDGLLSRHTPAEFAKNPIPLLTDLFAYMQASRSCFEVLAGEFGDRSFMHDLRSLCVEWVTAALHLRYPKMEESFIAYQAIFLVGGYENLLRRWVSSGCKETPAELARLAAQII